MLYKDHDDHIMYTNDQYKNTSANNALINNLAQQTCSCMQLELNIKTNFNKIDMHYAPSRAKQGRLHIVIYIKVHHKLIYFHLISHFNHFYLKQELTLI